MNSTLLTNEVPAVYRSLICFAFPPLVWNRAFDTLSMATRSEDGWSGEGIQWADIGDDGYTCPTTPNLFSRCEYASAARISPTPPGIVGMSAGRPPWRPAGVGALSAVRRTRAAMHACRYPTDTSQAPKVILPLSELFGWFLWHALAHALLAVRSLDPISIGLPSVLPSEGRQIAT